MNVLEAWFTENKRSFPWRERKTPYRVWISEVMLQQTRASVVVQYFENWMKLFPSIEALAKADLQEVIKAWEGLGYYSRARNIHKAAGIIVEKFQGDIPENYEQLLKVPGFGPYTAAAVVSFAFEKKAYAIDGNVNRVISRFSQIEIVMTKKAFHTLVKQTLAKFLDHPRPWVISEALIELGALICTKTPKCCHCPLRKDCRAVQTHKTTALPLKKEQKAIQRIFRPTFVIEHEGYFLIKENERGKIMGDLAEFPFVETEGQEVGIVKLLKLAQMFYGQSLYSESLLPFVQHSFTHFKAFLYPIFLKAKERKALTGFSWIAFHDLQKKAFSSGHKKILLEVAKIYP